MSIIQNFKNYISREFIYPKVTIPSFQKLDGLVVLVTGASRGIGKSVAEMILSQGGKVIAVSRDYDSLKEIFSSYEKDSVLLISGDISLEKDVEKIFFEALKKFGKIDVLVNNAGINSTKLLETTSTEEFDSLFGTNVRGAYLLAKGVIPGMKVRRNGFIINVGSKISHNTSVAPCKVLYSTTKHAIEGFSFALNRELKSFGIRVACIMPGTVSTFVSLDAKKYLSPYQVAEVVVLMIQMEGIDFESIIFKSKNQDI